MLPGMGKINPKQMQAMMRQMGIKSEELPAKRVVFELADKKLVIDQPNVTLMEVQGQKTFQVMGETREEGLEAGLPEEDVKMVAEQASVSEEKAREALQASEGDIAQAIEDLKKA